MGCSKSKIQDSISRTQGPPEQSLTQIRSEAELLNFQNMNIEEIDDEQVFVEALKPQVDANYTSNEVVRPNSILKAQDQQIQFKSESALSQRKVDFALNQNTYIDDSGIDNNSPTKIIKEQGPSFQPLLYSQRWLIAPTGQKASQNNVAQSNPSSQMSKYETQEVRNSELSIKPKRLMNETLEFKFEEEGKLTFLQVQHAYFYDAMTKAFISNNGKSKAFFAKQKDIYIQQIQWKVNKRTKLYEFVIIPIEVIPLQNYPKAFGYGKYEAQLSKNQLLIKFNVNQKGFLESIENVSEILKKGPGFEQMSRSQFDQELQRMEQEVKRLWSCIVQKWIGISKYDDITIKQKYKVGAEEEEVFEMEFIQDHNPQLIKNQLKDNLMNEDFYSMAVYKTVRKSVGKGIWIADYKKSLKDDTKIGVDSDSEEDSQELLKKELQFLDNIGLSSRKKKKSKIQEEPVINYYITNKSDSFVTHSFEKNLKPYKTQMRHQNLIVYSHRKNEYITVDVECDNRLIYFLHDDDQEKQKASFMNEVMEFIIESENKQREIKEMLELKQVPFNQQL